VSPIAADPGAPDPIAPDGIAASRGAPGRGAPDRGAPDRDAPDGWEGVRRVLAVRLDNIGDVVMLSPALRAVRAALRGASITLMASPAGSQAAPLLPEVDDVMVLRAVWQDASWAMPLDPARERALVGDLRGRGFDAAVIFTSFAQSPYPPAYACYLAGIPIRLGQSKEFGGSVLSRWVRAPDDGMHQVERNLHLLQEAGFAVAERDLRLRVPPAADREAARVLAESGVDPAGPFAVVVPGASAAARRYPAERFAEVAALLAAELPVLAIGSERERAVLERAFADAGSGVHVLAGRTTVPELAAVVGRSSLVVANNSLAIHLADAFRRPVVVTYSGTDLESQWAPRSAPAVTLRRPTFCSPCYRFECPYGLECLDLAPEEVASAGLALVARARQPAAR
jgi:ADP-heptose:LPS heptosyltransferase